jgi:hypothetical protein
MRRNRTLVSIVGMVCILALSGFRAANAGTTDPCKLLTPAEVGSTVGAGEPIGKTGCEWASHSPNVRATLVLWNPAGWERMKTPVPHIKRTSAGGIGDDAFYTTVGNLISLSVKKGGTVFIIRLYGVHPDARQMSAEKKLAGNVVARL